MITKHTPLELRANTYYGENSELNQDKWTGYHKRFGDYQQFQVLDMNFQGKMVRSGFVYVQVFTDLDLKVGDVVTVQEVLFVMRKGNTFIVGVSIKEKSKANLEMGTEVDCGF